MQETLTAIQNDSTLMLIGGIAIAVLLAVVLVIVVSAMRVKSYKDRFKNLLFETKEKSERITTLEKELQEYKIQNAKNQQELAQFEETKSTLKTANESYLELQSKFNESEKELSQTKAKLEAKEGMFDALTKEHQDLKERFETVLEENTKHRTNNARLLMKLDSEERAAQNMKLKQEYMDKNND